MQGLKAMLRCSFCLHGHNRKNSQDAGPAVATAWWKRQWLSMKQPIAYRWLNNIYTLKSLNITKLSINHLNICRLCSIAIVSLRNEAPHCLRLQRGCPWLLATVLPNRPLPSLGQTMSTKLSTIACLWTVAPCFWICRNFVTMIKLWWPALDLNDGRAIRTLKCSFQARTNKDSIFVSCHG